MARGVFEYLQHKLEARQHGTGLTVADLRALPVAERQFLNWLLRNGEASWVDVLAQLGHEAAAQTLIANLVAKGFIQRQDVLGDVRYQARLAARRRRNLPINLWQALTDKLASHAPTGD